MEDPKINVSPDEIVIVIPEDANEDELVIDLEELGIHLEQLADEVNIVVQVEGADGFDVDFESDDDDDDEITLPNEWYFDDDPYGIVYYEYVR